MKTALESLETLDTFFDSLKPGRFQYTYENTGQYHAGMYAQDVLESMETCGLTTSDFAGVVSRTISEDSIGYHGLGQEYGLNYVEFIPILIYQEQKSKSRISELETTVTYLQAAVESLVGTVMQAQA